jgi:hypothetical protein
VITGPGHGSLCIHFRLQYSMVPLFTRLDDYAASLMPMLSRQFAVPL